MNGRRAFLGAVGIGVFGTLYTRQGLTAPQRRLLRRPFRFGRPSLGSFTFVQPEYAAWQKVELGMSLNEVTILLGEALDHEQIAEASLVAIYGSLSYSSPAFPEPFRFAVHFANGKVVLKEDPFGSNLSRNGMPTTPNLVLPRDETVCSHYPRFLDLRWQPSSGVYPLTYEVEIGHMYFKAGKSNSGIETRAVWESEIIDSAMPMITISFVGASPGRWRVRGRNCKGSSAWSDYRGFSFTI